MLHSDGVPDAFPAEIIARYHVALDEYVQHKTSVNVSFCFGFISTIVLVFFLVHTYTQTGRYRTVDTSHNDREKWAQICSEYHSLYFGLSHMFTANSHARVQ
jgi:hypothetical protein